MEISRFEPSTQFLETHEGLALIAFVEGFPKGVLSIISTYLPTESFVTLSALSPRISEMSFSLSDGASIWEMLYKRDFFASFNEVITSLNVHLKPYNGRITDPLHHLTCPEVQAQLYLARASAEWSAQVVNGHTNWIVAPIELRDGRIVSVSEDYAIRVSPLEGGEPPCMLEGHKGEITAFTELRDGRIAAGSVDGTIYIWPLEGGEPYVLRGHEGGITVITELRDGRIASASRDRVICIGPLEGGKPRVLKGHRNWVTALTQLRDGRIASGSFDDTIRLWSLDGQELRVLKGHADGITALIQLRDGRIASASADRTICLWSLDDGESRVLTGHEDLVTTLIQLRDGGIASASRDGTIRLSSLNGGESRVLAGNRDEFNTLIELQDGRIALASRGHTIRLLDVNVESLVHAAVRLAQEKKERGLSVLTEATLAPSRRQVRRYGPSQRKLFVAIAIVIMGIVLKLIFQGRRD